MELFSLLVARVLLFLAGQGGLRMLIRILIVVLAVAFTTTFLTHTQMAEAQDVADGLVSYWSFDDVEGDTIEVNDDEWHHAAVTWDGSEGHVYTDGVEGTFEVNFDGGADNAGETVKLGITPGAHSEGCFEGLLDDFRIYDRALEEDDVGQIMADVGAAVSPAGKLTGTWGMLKEQ